MDALSQLREENARLVALLEQHGIAWQLPNLVEPTAAPTNVVEPATTNLSPEQKITLFRRLFRGRLDVYPLRWEGKTGKSGYAPACGNEWKPGICEKPRIKCGDCSHRQFLPVTDQVIREHLSGRITVGVYPLLQDDSCHFLAVDFDEADWREDAQAFMRSCQELKLPAALEISRSGNGAHVWIFFASAVMSRDARRLGTAIVSHTCARTRQLKLSSYDRLFPNQDTMPKGGFGNLIAMPLQKKPRENGASVFVDAQFQPYADQWSFLASLQPLAPDAIEDLIANTTGGAHPLDVTFIAEEDPQEPWKRAPAVPKKLPGPLPKSLTVTLANMLFIEKTQLPQPLANRLIRLAAFQNPDFYRAQAMRLPIWDKPRVIGCADNYPKHIALPRGCLDAVSELLKEHRVTLDLRDERQEGVPLDVDFAGILRGDQQAAVDAMLAHETGVLCAPTAFGKTVTAAALIAQRGVNTLILVHRAELLKQWKDRLSTFLGVGKDVVGTIGAGKAKPTGKIDIAVMQSLSRKGEINALVEDYGHIIVDECHHLSAVSFELLLKKAKARYVLGLTATPFRRDGQQPIIFMQCGPVRHTAMTSEGAPTVLEVMPHFLRSAIAIQPEAGIQGVFRRLADDKARTAAIADETAELFRLGRKVLVLTERTEHLDAIQTALGARAGTLLVLHGRMSKRQRAGVMAELENMPSDAPRVLLATGKLIGEGFDHPPLDTLVLAMPISWKGTLQQYAGRLHRAHASKTNVKIVDWVDTGHPAVLRMWDKRLRGYRAMGYQVLAGPGSVGLFTQA